jgi:DNA-binding MarR family transcriptional regulator
MDETETATRNDAVMAAYHRFRRADAASHRRVRAVTGMGENELRLVQYVLHAHRRGHDAKPTEIARHLGISSASTTALLDRLERGGSLERISHPTDRRSILIAPTPEAEAQLSETVEEYERLLERLSSELPPGDSAAIERFLDALSDAADSIAVDAPATA